MILGPAVIFVSVLIGYLGYDIVVRILSFLSFLSFYLFYLFLKTTYRDSN
jgi:hypothetical protein